MTIQQVVHVALTGVNSMRVVADDTDVFVFLLCYYLSEQLTCSQVMAGTSHGRTTVDIKGRVDQYKHVIPNLLPAHVLTGYDTVAYLWGMGKFVLGMRRMRNINHRGNHFTMYSVQHF